MGPEFDKPTEDVSYLLDVILDEIKPVQHKEGTLQMRITSLDYSSYVGRIAIGRIVITSYSIHYTKLYETTFATIIKARLLKKQPGFTMNGLML